jgi:hypothetical protein
MDRPGILLGGVAMNAVKRALDRWRGLGEASITVPPMDGAFRPNDLLDSAPPIAELPAPDCLAVTAMGLIVSSGSSLFSIDKPGSPPLASFDTEISALAGLPDGGAAVALADGRIVFVGGQHGGRTVELAAEMRCITALAAARDGTLLVANGSVSNGPGDWKRDLMEKNASGSLWRVEPASGARQRLAGDLAYPYGLLEEADAVVVSEAWRCALTRVSPGAGGRATPVLENLPAYPSRLSRDGDSAIWLALFAPRSQLIEFILSEDRYRKRMISQIDADFWVAPCLRAGRAPQEPTQQGGITQLGVLKARSPTFSYGLIARLDRAYLPIASFHSRAPGHRHGVTSCIAKDGRLFFAAKGDGLVAALNHEEPAS